MLLGKLVGAEQKIPLGRGVDCKAQVPVIVVFEGDEAEGLQATLVRKFAWLEHLGHAMHWPGEGLESDFDEVTLFHGTGKLQKSAGSGNGLQLGAALPIFVLDQGERGGSKLNACCTVVGVWLGKVCHTSPIFHGPGSYVRLRMTHFGNLETRGHNHIKCIIYNSLCMIIAELMTRRTTVLPVNFCS